MAIPTPLRRIPARIPARARRSLFKLSSRTLQVVGVAGIACVVVGAFVKPTRVVGIILIGLGTSLLASVLVAAVTLGRDEFLQQILGNGVQEVFANRKTHFDDEFWDFLLKSAVKQFRVLGTANNGWTSDPAVSESTREGITDAIVKRDVEVEFLWLDPDDDLAIARQREEERSTRLDAYKSILFFWDIRSKLPEDKQNRLVLKLYVATPSCGVIWADDVLIVTHYLAGNPNLHAPGLVLGRSYSLLDRAIALIRGGGRSRFPPVTNRYMMNFEAIRLRAEDITPGRIETLQNTLDALNRETEQLGLPGEADIRKKEA